MSVSCDNQATHVGETADTHGNACESAGIASGVKIGFRHATPIGRHVARQGETAILIQTKKEGALRPPLGAGATAQTSVVELCGESGAARGDNAVGSENRVLGQLAGGSAACVFSENVNPRGGYSPVRHAMERQKRR